MQGLHLRLTAVLMLAALAGDPLPGAADDRVVNGYTYFAPSVYLTPPIIYYDPALVIPAPYFIRPLNTSPPLPQAVYDPPAYEAPQAGFNPAWPAGYVPPSAYRERAYFSRNGLEYKYQEYAPGRAAPVYAYQVDPQRHGVRIRERFR